MIREFREGDLDEVMSIWLSGNREAHSFIPSSFFEDRFDEVSSAISKAEVYVFDDGEVKGFIGLDGSYVAGLFVRSDSQGRGIGRDLLSHALSLKGNLSVHVFSRNEKAMRFYLRNGFFPVCSFENEDFGENEVLLKNPVKEYRVKPKY